MANSRIIQPVITAALHRFLLPLHFVVFRCRSFADALWLTFNSRKRVGAFPKVKTGSFLLLMQDPLTYRRNELSSHLHYLDGVHWAASEVFTEHRSAHIVYSNTTRSHNTPKNIRTRMLLQPNSTCARCTNAIQQFAELRKAATNRRTLTVMRKAHSSKAIFKYGSLMRAFVCVAIEATASATQARFAVGMYVWRWTCVCVCGATACVSRRERAQDEQRTVGW